MVLTITNKCYDPDAGLDYVDKSIEIDTDTGVVTGDTNFYRVRLMLAGGKYESPGKWTISDKSKIDWFVGRISR